MPSQAVSPEAAPKNHTLALVIGGPYVVFWWNFPIETGGKFETRLPLRLVSSVLPASIHIGTCSMRNGFERMRVMCVMMSALWDSSKLT